MFTVANEKSPRRKKLYFDAEDFKTIKRVLKKRGFDIVTPKMMQRDAKRYGLVPPNTAQLRECEKRVIFKKDIDGYRIIVNSSFNPKTKTTTRYGAGSVMIVRLVDDKRIYFCPLNRTKNFIRNLLLHMNFWNETLLFRPVDQDAPPALMELHQTITGKTFWVGENPKNKVDVFDLETVPREYIEHIQKLRTEKDRFEKSRKPRGIKRRRRTIKKTWKKVQRKKVSA